MEIRVMVVLYQQAWQRKFIEWLYTFFIEHALDPQDYNKIS